MCALRWPASAPALTGRFVEAREWFDKARRVLEEQGARPLRAITDFDEAWMEVRRGEAGVTGSVHSRCSTRREHLLSRSACRRGRAERMSYDGSSSGSQRSRLGRKQ
ncbi:MAG TPA: hypothetical protein DEP35_10875 [Deltaproteobacteria bacterium]|nr:hypothetical protein [Deltaproteobacteria bacterium]